MVSQIDINMAWILAAPLDGHPLTEWRRDEYGNAIRYDSYGVHGQYGWVVDCSKSEKVTDRSSKPRAVHWKANRANDT